MNRFEYTNPALWPNEIFIIKQNNVRLYDGKNKCNCDSGEFTITTHRIFWGIPGAFSAEEICLAMHIRLIFQVEENDSTFNFSRSRHMILHVLQPDTDRAEGIQISSDFNYIKVSFRDGFTSDIYSIIKDCVKNKRWLIPASSPSNIKLRSGIIGIERSILEKNRATDANISNSFQDLNKLMVMAKNMVFLSKNISTRIRLCDQGQIDKFFTAWVTITKEL